MALHNERQLPSFLKAIEAAHLAEDPRFATTAARRENAVALTAILDDIFARRDLAAWRPILEGAGVTFGAVFSVNEAADDSQAREIGALVPFADGKGLTVSSPFHLDDEIKTAPRRAVSVSIRKSCCETQGTPPASCAPGRTRGSRAASREHKAVTRALWERCDAHHGSTRLVFFFRGGNGGTFPLPPRSSTYPAEPHQASKLEKGWGACSIDGGPGCRADGYGRRCCHCQAVFIGRRLQQSPPCQRTFSAVSVQGRTCASHAALAQTVARHRYSHQGGGGYDDAVRSLRQGRVLLRDRRLPQPGRRGLEEAARRTNWACVAVLTTAGRPRVPWKICCHPCPAAEDDARPAPAERALCCPGPGAAADRRRDRFACFSAQSSPVFRCPHLHRLEDGRHRGRRGSGHAGCAEAQGAASGRRRDGTRRMAVARGGALDRQSRCHLRGPSAELTYSF